LLSEKASPALVINERLLRFRRENLPEALTGATAWNGALVLDVDRDERSDVLLLPHGRSPVLLMHEAAGGWLGGDEWFRRVTPQADEPPPTDQRGLPPGRQSTPATADGFGTAVAVQSAGTGRAGECATRSAGLAQSRQAVWHRLDDHSQAEVVRLRWPANVWHA